MAKVSFGTVSPTRACRITKSEGLSMPFKRDKIKTYVGVRTSKNAKSINILAKITKIARMLHSTNLRPRRSAKTPSHGAIKVPMNCKEPKAVSQKIDCVSVRTYQPSINVSISKAQLAQTSAGH